MPCWDELRDELHERVVRDDVRGRLDVHGGLLQRLVHARLPGRRLRVHHRRVRLLGARLPMNQRAAAAVFVLFATLAGTAAAQPPSPAKLAYDEGTKAYGRGDFRGAAAAFARADALAPNDIALEAALDAAIKAHDPVLGRELLDRAKRTKAEGPLAESIRNAEREFPPDPPPAPAPATITPAAPAPPPMRAAPPPGPTGLSPIWFVASSAVTAALGGATLYFALETKNLHDTFASGACGTSGAAACRGLASDGARAQLVTNLLLAGTGVFAVTTAVLGIAFTRWHAPVKVDASPQAIFLSLDATF